MAREFINLDTRVDVLKDTFNSLTTKVGDLALLNTTGDSDLVEAINEHDAELGTITAGAMGTTASTVSTAIKELDSDRDRLVTYTGMPVAITGMDNSSGNVLSTAVLNLDSALGNRTSLSTKNSTTFVAAINEIHDSIGEVLMTTTATTIKAAINEHDAELGTISAGAMGTTASTVSTAMAELDGRLDSINTTQLISPKVIASDSASTSVLRGNLQVDTNVTFRQNLTVDSADITNDLTVGGTTTMGGDLELGSNDINAVTNVYVKDAIIHDGDTNTTVNFGTDTVNLKTGGTNRVIVTDTDTHLTHALRINDSAYVVGNFDVGGDVDIAGTLTVDGVVNFKAGSSGSITLGDANTDNVVFTADVNSHIIPNTDATYDLGSTSQEWNHGFFDGTVNADNLLADSATISGDLDVGGILEADAITVNSVALNEFIADTVGGMVTSNTESDIVVTYQDADNTLDFSVGNISGTAAIGTEITATANDSANETTFVAFLDGQSGTQGVETAYRLQYRPSTHMLHANVTGNLTGNVVGSVTGAQTGITSLGTLSALQVGSIALTNTTISTVGGTDLNITPVAGQQIVLDETINIDEGVVTGATSITSTNFVGNITGDVKNSGGSTILDVSVPSFTGTAAIATAITVADESTDTTCFPLFSTAATGNLNPKSGSNLLFNSSTGLLTATAFSGNLTGNVTGNTTGTAATVTGAAQSAITSLGTLSTLTVDQIRINDNLIGNTADTNLLELDANLLTVSGAIEVTGEVGANSLDIGVGGADINGTLEANAITIAGITLAETIADTVGGMVTSNTETGITVAYQDADNTLDFTIGDVTNYVSGSLPEDVEIRIHADQTNSHFKVPFTEITNNATANAQLRHDGGGGFTYNPSTNVLTVKATGADSATTATIATSATTATNVTVTANNTANETVYPVFVDGTTGSQGIETDAGMAYNPSSGLLQVGSVSATSLTGTLQTVNQNNITSVGALSLLNIGHASDTTLTRASAGVLAVEGKNVYMAGGTDVAVVDGGTGSGTASGARTNLGLGTLATLSTVNNAQWSGTDLAVVNGGTGSGTASGARTNLGLGSLATLSTVSNSNWSGTDLALANGGTGASTADGARDALDVQVYIEAESAGTPSAADFTNNNAILVVQY